MRLEERQTESPRNKIREGASLEEQVRSASCPSLADTLASVSQLCRTRIIKRGKIIPLKIPKQHHKSKNLPPPSPRSTWIAVPGWGENKKRPLVRVFSDKRSSQRALHRPKGDVRGKWNVPTETRSVDSWMKRSLHRHLRVPGCLPFEKLIPLRLRGCW